MNKCNNTQCIWGGGAAPSPQSPSSFFILRMTPLTATPLPRTARRNKKHKNKEKNGRTKQDMQHEQMQQHPCFIASDKECSKMKGTKTKKYETHGTASKKRTKVKKTSEFTGQSSKMTGKYQKKKENTWETQKTKKNPKKNKKNPKLTSRPKVLLQYYPVLQSTTPVLQRSCMAASMGQPILRMGRKVFFLQLGFPYYEWWDRSLQNVLFLEKNDPFHYPHQEREVASTETSNQPLRLRYGAPASMEHLEVMVGIFFFQVEDVWGGGRLVGFGLVGLLGRSFPFVLWGFWGCPGRNKLKGRAGRFSLRKVRMKMEEDKKRLCEVEGNLHFWR